MFFSIYKASNSFNFIIMFFCSHLEAKKEILFQSIFIKKSSK